MMLKILFKLPAFFSPLKQFMLFDHVLAFSVNLLWLCALGRMQVAIAGSNTVEHFDPENHSGYQWIIEVGGLQHIGPLTTAKQSFGQATCGFSHASRTFSWFG
jgi:hypothetical protein